MPAVLGENHSNLSAQNYGFMRNLHGQSTNLKLGHHIWFCSARALFDSTEFLG
jgi:hypothetical protein